MTVFGRRCIPKQLVKWTGKGNNLLTSALESEFSMGCKIIVQDNNLLIPRQESINSTTPRKERSLCQNGMPDRLVSTIDPRLRLPFDMEKVRTGETGLVGVDDLTILIKACVIVLVREGVLNAKRKKKVLRLCLCGFNILLFIYIFFINE